MLTAVAITFFLEIFLNGFQQEYIIAYSYTKIEISEFPENTINEIY